MTARLSARVARVRGAGRAPILAGAALALLLAAGRADAQAARAGAPVVEARLDLLVARETTVHTGGGVLWPAGRYVRLGVLAGGGVTHREVERPGLGEVDEDETVASGRVELAARFVVDPLADPFTAARTAARWLVYGGAGAGPHLSRGAAPDWRVFAVLGVAGPERGGWRPALELGLGGGVRVAFALRTGGPRGTGEQ